ncbi:predicted protein [Naegleria gruberi]|uniref:Predicted protein n=1 Tax=Naegleria gruberi TaxID=5762 RepID=D2VSW6_NAEGR|nr:uncharacterized protein NAEGRDRAFT_51996 [Naegleria gruberi]EFC39973.1 predicted protein [Naegleria gruberi]|eukprot:XP_002672717.1 predicted protein [Naegleria gruberi strain NEG-M]
MESTKPSSEMKMFMEKVGLDVFQFILSFLPPVPYLFQLQRVSKHYSQLCQSCMEEDCSELYWDEEAVAQMNDQMKKSSSNNIPNTLSKLLKQVRPAHKDWVLFFRDILHKFKKLDRLVLKNMEFSNVIMYLIFVDWKGDLKELKLIECDFKVQIPCSFSSMSQGQVVTLREIYFQVESFLDCTLDLGDHTGFMTDIQKSTNIGKIEKIKIVSKSNGYNNDAKYPNNGYGLIPFVKCFPSLKNIFCLVFRNKSPVWESVLLMFPDIVFEPLPRELTNNETNLGEFYIDYLCKEFNLRKNRLELIQHEFTSSRTRENIHSFFSTIIDFLEVHTPFGLDSLIKDVRGNNIIQLAILFTNYETVRFFVKYLTALEDKDHAAKELSQLFSANNRLDGRNALFKCISSSSLTYFDLLLEYGVSFNFPDSDGNTILHSLCMFGQLAKLQTLWDNTLGKKQLKEKMYYLNFNTKNKNGETPLYLCKKNRMNNMANQLQTQFEHYGIDLSVTDPVPPVASSNPTPIRNDTPSSATKCDIL